MPGPGPAVPTAAPERRGPAGGWCCCGHRQLDRRAVPQPFWPGYRRPDVQNGRQLVGRSHAEEERNPTPRVHASVPSPRQQEICHGDTL